MPQLPSIPDVTPQVEAPRARLSPQEIAQPYNELADNLDKAGNILMKDIAVPAAERQAATDLANQKITRNADGSINVENPATAPLIFGDAGQAYHKAVAAGTLAQVGNDLSQQMNLLHTKYPADPTLFKTASDALLENYGESLTPVVREAALREGGRLQTEHFNQITDKSASISIDSQKQSIEAKNQDNFNTAYQLASGGMLDSPQGRAAQAQLNHGLDALTTNPLFKMTPDEVALRKKNMGALISGAATVGAIDATYNKNGRAEAQKLLTDHVLNNTDLKPDDANRLYRQGMARLEYLSGDARAANAANKEAVDLTIKGINDGTIPLTSGIIGGTIERSKAIGDTANAARLTVAVQVRRAAMGLDPLPDAARPAALGLPQGGVSPVNMSIPPEGRALLKTIGSTESANRYNANYSGGAFTGFADHPGVHVPITSGPDVGKTTSAAGYYQFQKATWDAEKAKLGLPDFTPASQDTAAWDLAQTTYKEKTGKDLLTTLRSGNTADVLPALSGQWSSLPGGRQPAARYRDKGAKSDLGYTQEDFANNPYLASAVIRSQSANPDGEIEAAKNAYTANMKSIALGIVPATDSVALVRQMALKYPGKLVKEVAAMDGALADNKDLGLPADQHAQLLDQYRTAAAGADIYHSMFASSYLEHDAARQKNMAEHPYQEAVNRGWLKGPPPPIDVSNPQTLGPALMARSAASDRIATLNNQPPPPLLNKAELGNAQALVNSPDPAAKVKFFQSLQAVPEKARLSLLAQLGKEGGENMMVSAHAAALYSEAPSVALNVLRGQEAIKTGKTYLPEGGPNKANFEAALGTGLPASAFSIAARTDPKGAYATMQGVVRALYAAKSAETGDSTGGFDQKRLDAAINEATGGIATMNGGQFIMPQRGMTQSQVDGVLRGITDKDLQGVTDIKGNPITAQWLRDNAQLENVGDGRYNVRLGKGNDISNPPYAYQNASMDAVPPRFILDLRNRPQVAWNYSAPVVP